MYPAGALARDRFVLDRRAARARHDPWQYQDVIVEDELAPDDRVARVATVFLTGRECPWRCAMCDLWQYTTASDTPRGAVPLQIAEARREIRRRSDNVTQVKLYNAGSFFDPRAVPEDDYRSVAVQLADFDRVIVESHPALVGPRVDQFMDALAQERAGDAPAVHLEVAMGLETANPGALERLHKQMTLTDFRRAAEALLRRDVSLRAFALISPPFIEPVEQDAWLLESVAFAFACGAAVVSLVPTRPGNGTLEALAAEGRFRPPRLDDIERSAALALARSPRHGDRRIDARLFVDLWDLQRFSDCPQCFDARRARLLDMNLTQRVLPSVCCPRCGAGTSA